MRIEQLEYLVAIAQYKSLTEAGEHLHISQQALSTLIRKMEDELNVPLLIRTHRGSQLTEQGKALAYGANKILKDYRQLLISIKTQAIVQKETLHIGVSFGLMEAFFSNLFAQFCKEDPQTHINIQEDTQNTLIDNLNKGTIDFAVVTYNDYTHPEWLDNESLLFIPLLISKLYVRVALRSPLAQYDSISLETALKQKILIYQPSLWSTSGNPICETIEYFCPECQPVFENNYQMHYQKLLQGLGIAFTIQDNRSLKPEQSGLKLIPIKENIKSINGCLVLKEKMNPAIQYVLDQLRILCTNQNLI